MGFEIFSWARKFTENEGDGMIKLNETHLFTLHEQEGSLCTWKCRLCSCDITGEASLEDCPKKTERMKAIHDCLSNDYECMKALEGHMGFLICHNLKDIPSHIYYRGHIFDVRLLGKMDKRGNLKGVTA